MNRKRLTVLTQGFVFITVAVGQQYFPQHSFDEKADANNFKVQWYAGQLKALQEPSLWELSKKTNTTQGYRFLWLRSFHHPISIRLDVQPDGSGNLTIKICDGKGGYEPGKIIRNQRRILSPQVIAEFLSEINKQGYWDLPTEEPFNGTIGLDGAQWILEGVNKSNYKIVDRWSPKDGPIRELGLKMIDLAGLQLKKDEIY